jgi:hypothetical protein
MGIMRKWNEIDSKGLAKSVLRKRKEEKQTKQNQKPNKKMI